MIRDEVYSLISGERDYQDVLGASRTAGKPHDVGSYLTMIRTYVTRAEEAWTNNPGDEAALDQIRKIAGIAVHCMEDHGAPARTV